eukprot:s702_g11.t1
MFSCRCCCALLAAAVAVSLGLSITYLVDPFTPAVQHHEVEIRTSRAYAVQPQRGPESGLPTLLLLCEGVNAAMVTHTLLVADAAKPYFEVHVASFGGAYINLLEESGYPHHALTPQWTEEQTALLYAADQFESLSSPWTREVLQQQIDSSLALYKTVRLSARIARIPLFVDMSMTRGLATDAKALAASIPDDSIITYLGLRPALAAAGSWFMQHMTFLMQPFVALASEWNITGLHFTMDLMEGDFTSISDIPAWAGVRPAEIPARVRFIGPLYAKLKKEVPPEVFALRGQATRDGQPLLWFAMGSSGQPPLVLAILKELVRKHPSWYIVAPVHTLLKKAGVDTTKAEDLAAAGLASERLFLPTELLPAQKVEPLCDVAFTHGGQGTVQTSMCSGVPFLGVGMMPEQDINVRLAVDKGMAKQALKFQTPAEIVELLQEVASSEAMRERAAAVKEECRKFSGEHACLDNSKTGKIVGALNQSTGAAFPWWAWLFIGLLVAVGGLLCLACLCCTQNKRGKRSKRLDEKSRDIEAAAASAEARVPLTAGAASSNPKDLFDMLDKDISGAVIGWGQQHKAKAEAFFVFTLWAAAACLPDGDGQLSQAELMAARQMFAASPSAAPAYRSGSMAAVAPQVAGVSVGPAVMLPPITVPPQAQPGHNYYVPVPAPVQVATGVPQEPTGP